MTIRFRTLMAATVGVSVLLAGSLSALAGRGGGGSRGGGGGVRGGGGFSGGGFRGGEMGGFRGSPSFSMPRSSGAGGGMNRGGFQGGGFNGAGRSGFDGGGLNRNGGARSPLGNGAGPGNNPFDRAGRPGIDDNRFNRPGENPFVNNRPVTGNNVGGGNRTNIAGGDRTNIGGNRTNIGNQTNVGDRDNRIGNTTNINRNTVNNVNGNDFNRFSSNGFNRWGAGGWGYRPGYGNGYAHGWVNGYWSGHYWPGGWGGNNWWGALATGAALGGLAGWGLGTSMYGWGYGSYVNPYYSPTVVVQPPVVVGQPDPGFVYNYTQPIDTGRPPPDPAAVQAASDGLDEARSAFSSGDYAQALRLTDQALKSTPNDAAVHEFRALCLFALGRYDDAAAVLYAVLSVGPGWDWTTLISLYPSVDVYTQQLRALEAYRDQHPDSAAARFVLAYHYLAQGHKDDALTQLQQVVRLQPNDPLAAQLVKVLSEEAPAALPAVDPAPAQPTAAGAAADLTGQWTAPGPGAAIALTIGPGDAFVWNVTQNGQARPIQGKFSFADGTLTLLPGDNAQPLVGQVAWKDPAHFTFKLAGGPPGDPGLSFTQKPGG